MVSALVTKVRVGKRRADLSDRVGGSTFVFDVWSNHPMAEEVFGYLRKMREAGMDLRRRLEDHERANPRPDHPRLTRVISYVGQTVREEEESDDPE
jgi:hypothetical protein